MAVFAIIPQPHENAAKLGPAIEVAYGGAFCVLDGNAGWLVAGAGSAQDVSTKLDITTGVNGAAIVVEVASYFGRANPNIWSWIKDKWELKPNG